MALLFVTLPFVVRAVQPVLLELDREMEEAAASLGAGPLTTFTRVILPNLGPAILSGAALAFARGVGEFGSIVLISGNIPFHTQVASVFRLQADRDPTTRAAPPRSPWCCCCCRCSVLLRDPLGCRVGEPSADGVRCGDERSEAG